MKRFTKDRRLLTAFGLVVIFCLCSGCQSLHPRGKKQTANKHSSPSPTISSARAADAESHRPSSPTAVEPVVAKSQANEPPQAGEQLDPPPTPLGALPGDQNGELVLTITDAVSNALGNNLHLRVIEDLPQEAAKRAEMERAGYDAAFNTNAQYLNGTQQVASALQAVQGGLSQYRTTGISPVSGTPNLMSVEQRFSTGTTARIGVGPTYNYNAPMGQYLIYNPAYQSAASLVIEQAIFRGANRQANLAGIKIAETGQKQSTAEFQVEVNQTLTDVQRAYWLAWLANSQLKTFEELVEQAEATHALEQKRFEIGKGGIVQAASAIENLHSLKAELAQARQRMRAARNHLFTLMGFPPGDRRQLKLTEDPLADQVTPDLERGLSAAAQQRPEIQIRQLQVTQAQLELDRRVNNLRPDVRAYGGYSLTGLNNSLLGSVNTLGSGQFGMMSMGLRYTYVFGQRADKAALEQAQLAFTRQTKARQETEFLIQQQVRDAWDSVNSAWEVWRCQQQRVTAARVQAETFSQLYAAGQIDLDRVLRARHQLASALQQSQSALVDYNLALNSWRFAIGEVTTPLTPIEPRPRDPIAAKESSANDDSEPLHPPPLQGYLPPAADPPDKSKIRPQDDLPPLTGPSVTQPD